MRTIARRTSSRLFSFYNDVDVFLRGLLWENFTNVREWRKRFIIFELEFPEAFCVHPWDGHPPEVEVVSINLVKQMPLFVLDELLEVGNNGCSADQHREGSPKRLVIDKTDQGDGGIHA